MVFDIKKHADEIRENGFTVLKGLCDPGHVKKILEQINTVFETALTHVGETDMLDKSIDEKYAFLENNYPTLKSHCYDVMSMLDGVRSYVNKQEIFDITNELYNSPVTVDLTQVRVNAPDNKYVQPWHQEVGQMSELNMTVWTPLVDIDEEIGGLFVVPGSHKRGLVKHYYMDHPGMNKKVHAICEDEYANDEPLRVIVGAGDAIAFHPHLFHVTAENKSNQTRWTIVTRYNELSKMHYLQSGDKTMRIPDEYGTR